MRSFCNFKVLNNRKTELNVDERMMKIPYEVGILNICGSNVAKDFQFRSGYRRWPGESRGHAFGTLCCSNGFLDKPQPRLLENIKVWNSVQASNIPTSHSIYNADQAGTSVYHTVREGQTLTSIARQYDTPIQKIAVVNNIDNIDVLQAGQLLVVPVHPKVVQRVPSRTVGSDEIAPKDQNMMPVLTTPARLSTPAMPFSSNLQLVKATASLLVFAPVLAFCIRCWVDSIQLRTNKGGLKQHTQEENWTTQHEPKLLRWQGILDGDRDGEVLDNFAGQGHNRTDSQENQSQDAYEEIRQSYVELEPAYLKFLAESGLSKSGYWRGGVPSALDENILKADTQSS